MKFLGNFGDASETEAKLLFLQSNIFLLVTWRYHDFTEKRMICVHPGHNDMLARVKLKKWENSKLLPWGRITIQLAAAIVVQSRVQLWNSCFQEV